MSKRGKDMERCGWCLCNEKMTKYHDEEWGVPVHDDRKQFEFLMMEVMQCGLNWNMMIQKREIFQNCFDGFDFEKIAGYVEEDVRRILQTLSAENPGCDSKCAVFSGCAGGIRLVQRVSLAACRRKADTLHGPPERRTSGKKWAF